MKSHSLRTALYLSLLVLILSGCGGGRGSDRIVVVSDNKANHIDARLMFGYDAAMCPAGTAWMVGRILAGPYSDVAEKRLGQLADLGVTVSTQVGREVLIIDVDCPKAAWSEVGPVLGQHLLKPTFESSRIDELRLYQHAALDSIRHDSEALARAVFWHSAFDGTPYASPPTGTDSSIETITQEALFSFISQFITSENLRVGLAGPVSNSDADKFLSQLQKALPGGEPFNATPYAVAPQGLNVRIVQGDSSGGATILVGTTAPHASSDSSALTLAMAVALETAPGASLTGIDQSLRLERGIVSSLDGNTSRVASTQGVIKLQANNPILEDFILISAHAEQINALYAIRIILKELTDINTAGLSGDEMVSMHGLLRSGNASSGAVDAMRAQLATMWMGLSPEELSKAQGDNATSVSRARQMIRATYNPTNLWIVAVVPNAQSFEAEILAGMAIYAYPAWVDQTEIRRLDVEYLSFRPFWQADKIRTTTAGKLFR